jgi:hypothetical protein
VVQKFAGTGIHRLARFYSWGNAANIAGLISGGLSCMLAALALGVIPARPFSNNLEIRIGSDEDLDTGSRAEEILFCKFQ